MLTEEDTRTLLSYCEAMARSGEAVRSEVTINTARGCVAAIKWVLEDSELPAPMDQLKLETNLVNLNLKLVQNEQTPDPTNN